MAANQCLQNYKMSDKEIKVPNIGEFKDVEVIEVLVSNGQSVSKNDPLITIESDKSSVEIPSSYEGKVKSINIKVGDKISEGDTILSLEKSEEAKKETSEIVNDLIIAAYNNAKEKLKKRSSEELTKATGGINLPFDLKFPSSKSLEAQELLALINEKLWIGHFDITSKNGIPAYRHTVLSFEENDVLHRQLEDLVDIAIYECEKYYPSFQQVLFDDLQPSKSLVFANFEVIGTA